VIDTQAASVWVWMKQGNLAFITNKTTMNHNNANISCFSSSSSSCSSNNNNEPTMKGGNCSTGSESPTISDKNPRFLETMDPRVQVPVALNHQILSNVPIESLSKFTIAQQNAILASFSSKLESILPNNSNLHSDSLDENDPKIATSSSNTNSPMLVQQKQQPYRQKCLFLQAVQEMEKTLPATSIMTNGNGSPTISTTAGFVPPDFCLNGEAIRQYTLLPTRELQETASQYCLQAAHLEWQEHGRDIKQPHAFYNHHFFLWLSSSGVVTALASIPDFCLPEASQIALETQLSPTQQKCARAWCCTEAKKCRNAIRNPPSYYHKLFVKYLLSASSTPQEQMLGLELSEKVFGGTMTSSSSSNSSSAMNSSSSPLQAKPKSLSTRSSSYASSSSPPSPASNSPTIQLASSTVSTVTAAPHNHTDPPDTSCRCLAATLLAIEKETTKTLLEKLRAAEKTTLEAHQRIRTLQQEIASQRLAHEKARQEWTSAAQLPSAAAATQLQAAAALPPSPIQNTTHTPPPPTNSLTMLELSVSNMTAAAAAAPPGIVSNVGSGMGDDQSIESLLTLSPLDLGTTRSGEFHWPPPTKTMTLTTSSPTSVVSTAAAAVSAMTSTDPFAWFPTNEDNWAGSSNPSLNGSFSSLTMNHQPNNIHDSETYHHHHAPPGLGMTKHASSDTTASAASASVMDSLYFLSSPRDVFHVLSGPPGLPRLFPLDDTVVDDDDDHGPPPYPQSSVLLSATTTGSQPL
jgi:hypothetical protein